jgi:uncharacterized SAM-binding protein YcdF (DUF218 family)
MLVLAMSLLGILGIALLAARRRRSGGALCLLAVLLFLADACGPLPAWLLARLQAPYAAAPAPDWGRCNAIVLLGAGTVKPAGAAAVEPSLFAYGRIARAAALYRACRQSGADCRLLVSGGDAVHTGASEAEIYGALLRGLGVDAADLVLEARSLNTWQNAQFSAPLLRAYGADRVLLVSSGLHLRRSLLYFAHFGVDAVPVRADYVAAVPAWLPSGYNLALGDLAWHEYEGVLRYHLYNAMGWNAPPTRPGQP